VFDAMGALVQGDGVLCVGVGDNADSFGRDVEGSGHQDVLMSARGHGCVGGGGEKPPSGERERRRRIRPLRHGDDDRAEVRHDADTCPAQQRRTGQEREMLGAERATIEVMDEGLRHSVRIGDVIDFEIEDIVPFGVETGRPVRFDGMFPSGRLEPHDG
jgi:hypothetical protein